VYDDEGFSDAYIDDKRDETPIAVEAIFIYDNNVFLLLLDAWR